MLQLDLHVHSQYSEDGAGSPQEIIKVLKKRGLHGVSITDHNDSKGSLEATRYSSEDFVVIPGIEISTADGHLLAYDVKEKIQRGLTVEETVEKIISIGGVPVIPHLFRTMSGIKMEKFHKIRVKVPAIEVFNACSVPKSNVKTAKISRDFGLGGIGGSDSHSPHYAGLAYTVIDTTDFNKDTIISEIIKKRTWGKGKTMPLSYRRERMLTSLKQFFGRGFKRI